MQAMSIDPVQTPPRGRGRPPAGEEPIASNEALLDQALEIFADHGYEGASVRELARRLGVSHGLLHSKFGSKRNLWEAAVDHAIQRLERISTDGLRRIDPDAGVVERLRIVCVGFLLGVADEPSILRIMNHEGTRESDRLDYIARNYFEAGAVPLGELLAEGRREGVLRPIPMATFFLLLAHGGGALFGLRPLAKHLGTPRGRSQATLRAQAEEVVEVLLRGIEVR